MSATTGIAADLFRREGSRIVMALTAQLGVHRLPLAEDAVQEALVRAMQTWPYRGIPANPGAWLTQTAKNVALDFLRREQRWNAKQDSIAAEHERWLSTPPGNETGETLVDDTLRMMFVCFHPQLSIEAQNALALRIVCGLSAAEIAAAYLTTEAAIAKRLVRARQRIRELELPFAVPEARDLPERLDGMLQALYLLFNEGYKASGGDHLIRADLCHEAIRLIALLCDHPATQAPRCFALHALMCLNASRLSARLDDGGNLLRLHEQARHTWDHALIQQGIASLARSATGDALSTYHLEAGIAACHALAADDQSTDWPRILSLYDQLLTLTNSPVTGLNRAIAISRVHGPQAGLNALNEINRRGTLETYHLYHATRGTFHAELGESKPALTHFNQAAALVTLPAEKEFIARRIREITSGSNH